MHCSTGVDGGAAEKDKDEQQWRWGVRHVGSKIKRSWFGGWCVWGRLVWWAVKSPGTTRPKPSDVLVVALPKLNHHMEIGYGSRIVESEIEFPDFFFFLNKEKTPRASNFIQIRKIVHHKVQSLG